MEPIGDILNESATAKELRRIPTVSAVLSDGATLEMILDRSANRTAFVLAQRGEWTIVPEHALRDGRVLVPLSPHNNLLVHDVVLFAERPIEYGTKADLLGAVTSFIRRHVDLSPLFETIAAHYVLLTWLYDDLPELPYLRVKGEPGSGKTRFLLTVGALCNKPIFASGASTVSPVFRMLDLVRGTLVLDEADFRFSDEKAEVTKILNNGIMPGFPVLRSEQDGRGREFNPRAYHVFGPKLLATRNGFDDRALESRFISEEMGARGLRADVPISLPAAHAAEARALRNQLLLFRLRHRGRWAGCAMPPAGVAPRLAQMFGPLMMLIDDAKLRSELLALVRGYDGQMAADRAQELDARVFVALHGLWESRESAPSVDAVRQAYAVLNPEQPLTSHAVGRVLRGLGFQSRRRKDGYALLPSDWTRAHALARRFGLSDVASPGSSPSTPSSSRSESEV